MGIALLVGLANGALHGAQNAQQDGQDRLGYSALLNGLAAISPTYPTALRIAEGCGQVSLRRVRLHLPAMRGSQPLLVKTKGRRTYGKGQMPKRRD